MKYTLETQAQTASILYYTSVGSYDIKDFLKSEECPTQLLQRKLCLTSNMYLKFNIRDDYVAVLSL